MPHGSTSALNGGFADNKKRLACQTDETCACVRMRIVTRCDILSLTFAPLYWYFRVRLFFISSFCTVYALQFDTTLKESPRVHVLEQGSNLLLAEFQHSIGTGFQHLLGQGSSITNTCIGTGSQLTFPTDVLELGSNIGNMCIGIRFQH